MDEQYILDKIKELAPGEHIVPSGVIYSRLKTAIQKDLSKIMTELFKKGKITYRKTLNDLLINIKRNEQ